MIFRTLFAALLVGSMCETKILKSSFSDYIFYRWKQIEVEGISNQYGAITNPDSNLSELTRDQYVAYNNVPMGVSHYRGRLFITIPRRRFGVPATLAVINVNNGTQLKGGSPKIRPYPDLITNTLTRDLTRNSDRLISVYRIKVDVCDRLWFVDTGMLEIPNNRQQVQPPSLWVIDLKTNQRIRRFEIPASVNELGNGFATITVDVQANNCLDAYAYIPDYAGRSLSVYSLRLNKIWTFRHNYFSLDPIQGDFNVAGQQFQWDDGIFSVTLGPIQDDGYRTAYFLPLASISEFSVNTRVLRNESNSARSNHGNDFKFLGQRGKDRMTIIQDLNLKTGVMVYAEIGRNALGCWNTNMPFSADNHHTIIQDKNEFIYPGGLSIDEDSVIWVLTNTFPRWIYDRLDTNEYNFKIWRIPMNEAIENTGCKVKLNSKPSGKTADLDSY